MIDKMWSTLKSVDPNLNSSDMLRKSLEAPAEEIYGPLLCYMQIQVSNQKVWELDMQHM